MLGCRIVDSKEHVHYQKRGMLLQAFRVVFTAGEELRCRQNFGEIMMAASRATDEERKHNHHRTIDRVARLIEEIVYNPGMTFGDLMKKTELPKSTLHGFVEGLLANGWLHEQRDGSQYRLHLGPAVYGLILSSGKVRAGAVSNGDLFELHSKVNAEVYLGVLVGDQLVYVAEAGADPVAGFHPRNVIRRDLLLSAGGKALLASQTQDWIESFLRSRPSENDDLIRDFLAEVRAIRSTGVAQNYTQNRTRFALASVLRNNRGKPAASITVVGSADDLVPRQQEISKELLQAISNWERRESQAREAI